MKAKFVGDPADNFSGAEDFNAFGVDFQKGKWVEIEDAATFKKLEANTHFETQGGADDKKAAAVQAAAGPKVAAAKAEAQREAAAKFKVKGVERPRDKKPELVDN